MTAGRVADDDDGASTTWSTPASAARTASTVGSGRPGRRGYSMSTVAWPAAASAAAIGRRWVRSYSGSPVPAVDEQDGNPSGDPGRGQVQVGDLVRAVAVGPAAVGCPCLAFQNTAILGHGPSMATDLH